MPSKNSQDVDVMNIVEKPTSEAHIPCDNKDKASSPDNESEISKKSDNETNTTGTDGSLVVESSSKSKTNGVNLQSGLTPDEAAAFEELSMQLREHYGASKSDLSLNSELANHESPISNDLQKKVENGCEPHALEVQLHECDKKSQNNCLKDMSENLSGETDLCQTSAPEGTKGLDYQNCNQLSSYQLKVKNLLGSELSGNYWVSQMSTEMSLNGRPKRSIRKTNEDKTNKNPQPKVEDKSLTKNTNEPKKGVAANVTPRNARKRYSVNAKTDTVSCSLTMRKIRKTTKEAVPAVVPMVALEKLSLEQKPESGKCISKSTTANSENHTTTLYQTEQPLCTPELQVIQLDDMLRTALCVPYRLNPRSYRFYSNALDSYEKNYCQNVRICKGEKPYEEKRVDKIKAKKGRKRLRLFYNVEDLHEMNELGQRVAVAGEGLTIFSLEATIIVDKANYLRDQDVIITYDPDSRMETEKVQNYTSGCGLSACMLGCICSSLNLPKEEPTHCGKFECMFMCTCKNESDGKELLFYGNEEGGYSDLGNKLSEAVSCVLSREFYYLDESFGVMKRIRPLNVVKCPLPFKNKVFRQVFCSARHWVKDLLSNELRTVEINEWDIRPVLSSKEPVSYISKSPDVLVTADGMVLAYINFMKEKIMVPQTIICINENVEVIKYPFVCLSEPLQDEMWIFYKLGPDAIKLSKIWLIEIGVILDIGQLLTNIAKCQETFPIKVQCASHLKALSCPGRPDIIYALPYVPGLLLYGPVKTNCVISEGIIKGKYLEWYDQTLTGNCNLERLVVE